MAVHEVLETARDQVVARWKVIVRDGTAPEALATPELLDHIPEFLDSLHAVLTSGESLSMRRTAAEHGRQRLRLGFSLDSIVHEYGALQNAIVATAAEAKVEVSVAELMVVFDHIIAGIAHAVAEYARQRDMELQRQTNEHFAFVAHELRNPISNARTALSLLRSRGRLPENDRAVDVLERAIHGTTELIDETLASARLAAGVEVRKRWFTLAEIVHDLERPSRLEAEARGLDLRIEIQGNPRLFADRRLLRSAIGNLLGNAIKYTPADRGCVELRAKEEDGQISIEVEDCCGGLPPGKVEEVFAPFVRLDEREHGFGLGLAISRQAADAHGGTVRVQNLPEKGCVFVLTLPAEQNRGSTPGASSAA